MCLRNSQEMGERLASAGYVVLLPDLFYRAGPYAPINPAELFADPEKRTAHGKFFTSTSNAKAAADTRALLDYLDTRADVAGKRVGVTGYCMGGGVNHRVEIWPGTAHGWTMKDIPIYNEAAAERHWHELLDLFDATLH